MAEAVNRLLVVGFYMLNLGYAFLIFESARRPADALGASELLVNKLGILLVSLGVIHFFNIIIFWRIRNRSSHRIPPIPPQAILTGDSTWND